MKVGDYVRTRYSISKCIRVVPILENSFMYEFDKEIYEDVNYLTASELKKYKSSPNIIDLIEIGDYVNGNKIIEISKDYCGRTILIYGYDDGDRQVAITIFEDEIKSIVTKEQFSKMEYKVGK